MNLWAGFCSGCCSLEKTPIIRRVDALPVLRRHCLRSTPATVRPMADNTVFSATFSSCSTTAVKLDLEGRTPVAFPTSGMCSVVFCHGVTTYHFMASVLEPSSTAQAVLAIPTQIAVERRSSLRVPIKAGLHIELKTGDGRRIAARPQNLSLSGVFVGFAPDEDPGLSVHERISVELRLAHESASVDGWIRRHVGNSYGIAFSPVESAKTSEPPAALRRVYTALRQREISPNVLKAGAYRAGTVAIAIPAAKGSVGV